MSVIDENLIQDIVAQVLAKMQIAENAGGKHGVFTDMNEAIAATQKAQKIVRNMTMDQRERIISNIRKMTM